MKALKLFMALLVVVLYLLNKCNCFCPAGTYEEGGSCKSCPQVCEDCISSTVCSSCSSDYYQLRQGYCYDICGDSIYMNSPCDQEIGIEFDGCTDQCLIQDGFVCKIEIDQSLCSYSQQLEISFSSLQKIETHRARIQFKIHPPLKIFDEVVIQDIFSFNVSVLQIESISWNKENNQIEIIIFLEQSIQTLPYAFQFTPSASVHSSFYMTPTSVYEGKIDLGKYYGGKQKEILYEQIQMIEILIIMCVVLAWLVWAVGIFSDKLGGLETLVLVQYAWIAHVWTIKQASLTYSSLALLRFSSGYNYLFSEVKYQTQLPHAYFSNLQMAYFYNNFNLIIFLIILPLLFFIFFKVYRPFVNKKRWDEVIEQRYQKSQELLMYSVISTLLIFCSSSLIYFRFGDTGSVSSLIFFSFVCALICFVFIKFLLTSGSFLRFRFSFRHESLFFKHYLIYTPTIIVNVLLIGLLQSVSWVPIIPSGLLLLYTIILHPYLEKSDNYRAVLTCFAMMYVSGLRFIIESFDFSQQSLNLLLFILLGLVCYVEVITLIQTIYFIYQNWRIRKEQERQEEQMKRLINAAHLNQAEEEQKRKKMMQKLELNLFAHNVSHQSHQQTIKVLYDKKKKQNDQQYHSRSLSSDSGDAGGPSTTSNEEREKRKPFVLPKANIMGPFKQKWGKSLKLQDEIQEKNEIESIIEEEGEYQAHTEQRFANQEENPKAHEKPEIQISPINQKKKIKEMMKEQNVFVKLKISEKYKGTVDKTKLETYRKI